MNTHNKRYERVLPRYHQCVARGVLTCWCVGYRSVVQSAFLAAFLADPLEDNRPWEGTTSNTPHALAIRTVSVHGFGVRVHIQKLRLDGE